MNERALLKKTITLAKTGDEGAFESFYILTVQNTYAKISLSVRNRREADELLVDTYVMLYRNVQELPLGEEALEDRINNEIRRIAYKKLGIEIHNFFIDEEYTGISEERAATLWLRIEEKIGFNRKERSEEKNPNTSDLYSAAKILLTFFVLLVTIFTLYKGWNWFKTKGNDVRQNAVAIESQEETGSSAPEIIIEKELLEPGWEQRPDGSLYYVMQNGEQADKALSIGKQILTFSASGELTLIGNNLDVSANPDLSFDEDVRYEVRKGDIYKKDITKDEAETCVVMNGHVVQADVRCGFLWYIAKYSVPNSEQVKTTIYRAGLDGEKQEEIYTTENTLKTERFQVTSGWMYYISNGMLLRKNLQTDGVELMADNVEYYFAWEDIAYYMRDRALESVSQGTDYSGIAAGYKIELQGNGLVLLDAVGEAVVPDENGEKQVGDRIYRIDNGFITSTRPAVREDEGVIYYIESAGRDKKIYSTNSSGSLGLIRQDGISADSFCIAGEWLYYSARTAEYGSEVSSSLYRLNLQTMESETVGESFQGYMRNLYYFDNLQMIFGEYIPAVADPEQIHGQIAAIPIGEVPQVVNDTGIRPSYEGSDMLEIVMADGSRLYGLYHECSYNIETGELELLTSEPIEIPFHTARD